MCFKYGYDCSDGDGYGYGYSYGGGNGCGYGCGYDGGCGCVAVAMVAMAVIDARLWLWVINAIILYLHANKSDVVCMRCSPPSLHTSIKACLPATYLPIYSTHLPDVSPAHLPDVSQGPGLAWPLGMWCPLRPPGELCHSDIEGMS